jgi:DNA-binding protein YbaB
MKKWVVFFVFLVSNLSVKADNDADKQIREAKFKIVKESIEFLASDKETFKDARQRQCPSCKSYEELVVFVKNNKIKKADQLIGDWQSIEVDGSVSNWKKSLISFKDQVITKITSGPKSNRKKFSNYDAYKNRLDLIIENVSISELIEDVPDIQKIEEEQSVVVEPKVTEPVKVMSEKSSESASFFAFLPDISKDMSYIIILLLLAVILFLLWVLRNKNQVIDKSSKTLDDHLHKSGSTEWQSKNLRNELKAVQQKLKEAEVEIAALQDNVRAEVERNERLSIVPEIEKPVQQVAVSSSEPSIKYARYADQGDGFSVQELLDEEDSETIFELTILSPNTASFKISGNQNAQRYALSNSPYFLGKTSQYDTFPSGNSLINTDIPGELKLQGSKWLIIKPIQISFS